LFILRIRYDYNCRSGESSVIDRRWIGGQYFAFFNIFVAQVRKIRLKSTRTFLVVTFKPPDRSAGEFLRFHAHNISDRLTPHTATAFCVQPFRLQSGLADGLAQIRCFSMVQPILIIHLWQLAFFFLLGFALDKLYYYYLFGTQFLWYLHNSTIIVFD